MNLLLKMSGLALLGWSTAYSQSSRDTRQAALREAFHFSPAPEVATVSPPDESVIVLENLTITESQERRDVAAQIQSRRANELADAFAWNKGGLISSGKLGNFQADKGIWVTLGDRTSGAQATREIFIKVELLRLRW